MEAALFWCALAFAPFDGVLLDDPRDPIPGALAIQLHFRIERTHAARDRRPTLPPAGLRDRATACQALLKRGILPAQLRALEAHGLDLGRVQDPLSLRALERHLEAYLRGVAWSGYLEPTQALWEAAGRHLRGERGFWVERHPEDGPLEVGLRELDPPLLRALCALPELGTVRFRLATRRGAGRAGLFTTSEPHLVRQLIPALENLAVERGLEHLELDQPVAWGENPWGEALDGLFAGPLALDAQGREHLRRAELPTEAAVWRGAVEQVRAWVDAGVAPHEITLIHPDPARLAPLLQAWLAAEGVPLNAPGGRTLAEVGTFAPLLAVLRGLRDGDPTLLAAGLGATSADGRLGQALRALAENLDRADAAGAEAMEEGVRSLRDGDQAWLRERWSFLRALPAQTQPMGRWLQDLEALAQRLDLIQGPSFYPALGLLQEGAAGDAEPIPFPVFLESLEAALEALRESAAPGPRGVQLLGPETLESSWSGSRATLVLDLGEGAWPAPPAANPHLDWPRLRQINAALRSQPPVAGQEDFPPHLQTFPLPLCEEGETLPRAFHAPAFGFNRALALTREHFVALSSARDAEGQRRAQGPFWRALDGAGPWSAAPSRAASRLRWRWECGPGGALAQARQRSVPVLPVDPATSLARSAPTVDHLPEPLPFGHSEAEPLSPTTLEGLARCPFRVMADRLWNLPAWAAEDRHPLRVGSLAHRLMEEALRGLEGEPHWPDAFRARHGCQATPRDVQAVLSHLWARESARWIAEWSDLRAAEAQRLRLALEDQLPTLAVLLAEDLQEGGPTPEELALLAFEPGGEWSRELVGLEVSFPPRRLPLPGGTPLWVRGTVDRLERLSRGGTQFLRILDYKSSARNRLQHYVDHQGAVGAHLQLPLYQLLVEAAHDLPATALLLSLKEGWNPVPMMLAGEARVPLLANVEALILRARRGDFPAIPGETCDTCGLSSLCGRPVDVDVPEVEGEES